MMGTELTLKRKKEVGWRLVGRADGKYEKMEKKRVKMQNNTGRCHTNIHFAHLNIATT